jgi:hypothetical protein
MTHLAFNQINWKLTHSLYAYNVLWSYLPIYYPFLLPLIPTTFLIPSLINPFTLMSSFYYPRSHICFGETGLFDLTWSLLSSVSMQITQFHSSLLLTKTPSCIYTYHIFFINSSIDGHLGWENSLAIVSSAEKNIGVQLLSQLWVLGIYPQQ